MLIYSLENVNLVCQVHTVIFSHFIWNGWTFHMKSRFLLKDWQFDGMDTSTRAFPCECYIDATFVANATIHNRSVASHWGNVALVLFNSSIDVLQTTYIFSKDGIDFLLKLSKMHMIMYSLLILTSIIEVSLISFHWVHHICYILNAISSQKGRDNCIFLFECVVYLNKQSIEHQSYP